MSTQDERKAELERKKQRLAEIREEKRRREDEKRRKLLDHQKNPDAPGTVVPSQQEVDKILMEAGIDPDRESSPSKTALGTPETGRGVSPARTAIYSSSPSRVGGLKSLMKTETTQVNIPPREHIAYPKSTQTDVEGGGREFAHGSLDFWEEDALTGGSGRHHTHHGSQDTGSEVFTMDESPTHQLAGLLPHISVVKPTEVGAQAAEAPPRKPDYTEEEKQQILTTQQFTDFFDRATRLVERALYEEVDIYTDYSRDETMEKSQLDSGARLSVNRCFVGDISRGRVLSCLDYSPQHPELIVASYNDNPNAPNEPDGCVLVWNSKFKKDTPEYVFHSQSRVTSVSFGKFHPNLILGGTYSGQICLWDNRQHKKTPVQKVGSPLSTSAHTHPVFSMSVVGTQNAHNLVTVSTDGRMCAWSLDMLAQPQETIDLQRQNKQMYRKLLESK